MASEVQVDQSDSSRTSRDKRVSLLVALATLVVLYLFLNSSFSPFWRHTTTDVDRVLSKERLVGQSLSAVEQRLRSLRLDHGDSLVITGYDATSNTLSAEIPEAHHFFMIPKSLWIHVKFGADSIAKSYEVTGNVETAL